MNKYLATLKCHWIPIRKSSLSALLWDEAFVNGIPPLQNKLDKKINDLSKIQASWESSQIVYFFLSVPFPCFFFKKQKLTKPNQRNRTLKAGAGQSTCYPRSQFLDTCICLNLMNISIERNEWQYCWYAELTMSLVSQRSIWLQDLKVSMKVNII